MSKTIIVAVLVAVVIITECVFAYLLIPSTADVEAWAKAKAGEKAEKGEHAEDAPSAHAGGHAEIEVDLGKFNVVVHQPSSQVTLRVNFHLIGTVAEEEHTEFEHLLEKHQHRLRDHAIFEIRNCQIDDLTDPGLALLKRRILAKSNELLGKPLLRSVVFSDFSFVEQ
jgi:flagellar FliL protein